MTAKGQNIEMYQGDTKRLRVSVIDDYGAAFPLTSCELTYVLFKQTSKEIMITKVLDSGITIEDESGGILIITLSPEDTENLLGQYGHECELIDGAGNVSTIFVGSVKILNSET